MAESLVQVTEGVGKKLHTFQRTIGANNVEDEVVIPGEPYLATYLAEMATAVTMNNVANTQLWQLMAGATLKIYVRRITIFQLAVAAGAVLQNLDVVRVTTAPTGGTAITPSPLDPADAPSGATAAFLPGVAGTVGARVGTGVLPVVAAAPTAGVGPRLDFLFPSSGPKSLIIAAGTTNGIVVRNLTGANTGTIIGEILFQEANF